jgi:hypothetical protein
MTHSRRIHAFIAMVSLISGSSIALAHDGIEHVMGTVKTVSDTSITVETVKHEMAKIALDPTTKFTNKDAKASVKDLKAGTRVVVDTKDDASDKPHALTVKWGTSAGAAAATGKATPKMDPKMKM